MIGGLEGLVDRGLVGRRSCPDVPPSDAKGPSEQEEMKEMSVKEGPSSIPPPDVFTFVSSNASMD